MTDHPTFLTAVTEKMDAVQIIMLHNSDPNMSRTYPEIQSFNIVVDPKTLELIQPQHGVGSTDSNDVPAGAVAPASYPRTNEQVKEIHTGEAVVVVAAAAGKQGSRKRKQDLIILDENDTQQKKKLYELSPDGAEIHGVSAKQINKAIRSKQYRVQKNTEMAKDKEKILQLQHKCQQLEADKKDLQDKLALANTKVKELEVDHELGTFELFNTDDLSTGFVDGFKDSLFTGLLPEEEEPAMHLQKLMQ